MTDKEIIQNNLIELIEDWIERGKPLGLSNARQMIDEYEKVVKNLTIPRVSNSLLDLDGKTIPVTFHVSKFEPKIDIDLSNDC